MKKILSTVLLSACAMGASAAVNPDDYPVLELGKEYTLEAFGTFKGKIVAPESGLMIEYGNLPVYTLGADNELQHINYPDWQYAGYINNKQAYQFAVTEGTTYFVEEDFIMNAGTITFEMNPKVKIVDYSPALGEVFDVADSEFIGITFNQNVTIGKATVSCGNLSETFSTRNLGSDYALLVRDAMLKWYDADAVKGGETLTVLLEEVKDAAGNDVEPIELNYIVAYPPYRLVDTKLPEAILSYMPESSDATKAVFTFSGPMAPNPDIRLCYSPIELGYEYVEQLEATVEGNTVTVDFAGKLRVSAEMSPTGLSYPQFDLRLIGIRDARGQIVLSGEGMRGSFHLQVPFAEIPRLEVTTQFTPENGADLGDAKEIKIYFNKANDINYTGVTFTSGAEQTTVDKSAIAEQKISADEVELTVPVPEGWASKPSVKVCLAGLQTSDGYDHSADFTAKYNGFTLTFVNPADGSRLASLAKGRTITVDSNLKSGSELTFAVSNPAGEVIYGPVAMAQRSEGSYVHAMESEVTLYTSTVYTLSFTNGNATETVSIIGMSPAFEFSANDLTAVDPQEGSAVTDGQTIHLSFAGLVTVEPVEGSAPFTAATTSDYADGNYDNEWALTLGDLAGATEVNLAFRAYDQENLVVQGNQGTEKESYFLLKYNTESGIIELPADVNNDINGIYDLNGRRLNAPVKGVNIINGHKVLVK